MLATRIALAVSTVFAAVAPAGAQGASPPVTVPPPPVAMRTLPEVAATPAAQATALRIVQLFSNEAFLRATFEKAYTVTLPPLARQRPEFQALEARYPGVVDAALKAERSIVEPDALARLPQRQERQASLLARRLTVGELEAVLQFYQSPAGAKAIKSLQTGVDLSAMAAKNLEDPDRTVASSELRDVTAGGVANYLSSLTTDDQMALLRFAGTPAGRKWRHVSREMLTAATDDANDTKNQITDQAAAKVLEAVTEFIKRSDAAQTKK